MRVVQMCIFATGDNTHLQNIWRVDWSICVFSGEQLASGLSVPIVFAANNSISLRLAASYGSIRA